jgi:hypothetical protein
MISLFLNEEINYFLLRIKILLLLADEKKKYHFINIMFFKKYLL